MSNWINAFDAVVNTAIVESVRAETNDEGQVVVIVQMPSGASHTVSIAPEANVTPEDMLKAFFRMTDNDVVGL